MDDLMTIDDDGRNTTYSCYFVLLLSLFTIEKYDKTWKKINNNKKKQKLNNMII